MNNSYILIGIENFIDHILCIQETGVAYWKKSTKKMNVGDIVYLFISDKKNDRVMYRLQVIDTDSVRNDRKYWHSTYIHDTSCFKLKNIAPTYVGNGLDRNDLEAHGISRYVQYKKLSPEQATWLASHF
ncbi:MAG: hypothetical protein J6W69_07600 [Bacteroidales bacterium]|nr:hypothetical protein [Bacteroidales bacterium]